MRLVHSKTFLEQLSRNAVAVQSRCSRVAVAVGIVFEAQQISVSKSAYWRTAADSRMLNAFFLGAHIAGKFEPPYPICLAGSARDQKISDR